MVLIEGLKREAEILVGKRCRSWVSILKDVNKVAKKTNHDKVTDTDKIQRRFSGVLRPKYVTFLIKCEMKLTLFL